MTCYSSKILINLLTFLDRFSKNSHKLIFITSRPVGAKLSRVDIRTERRTDGRTDMAKPITSFEILQKRSKIFPKIISRTNFFVHYIKFRPNYDYGPYCKAFMLNWVLEKSKERQFVVTLKARTVIRRML
jgi:hypothetical protein